MSLLETFLTASQGATILFLAMLIYWQKAINPSGLAFGQLRCIRGKNAAYPDISLGNLNSDIYAWDPVNRR
ncbi:hypothetical protein BANRA_05645 [Klebsiella pneumoniae]|nr:hypothetical protein BANRA_05645 [Klebsiella pneumoniae]